MNKNMFVNNINPVLLEIGPVQVRYYGLVYALGFLAAYLILRQFAKKEVIKNFNEESAETLILYIIVGLVVGSRLFNFIFYDISTLITNPLEIFFIWHGGMSFHGGLAGTIAATYLFCKKYKVRFYQLADILVLPAALTLFFGRIANFINSELVGTPSNTPWCVVFQKVDNTCRHPSQLYEAGKNLFIFFIVMWMTYKKKWKEGTIFWTFVLLYGILRFIVNFWRDDPELALGISTGQTLSIILVPIAAYFLWKINKEKNK
jgi:phosphatidylglycerol:prolipoprotein diacylglycerol transferase